MIGNQEMEVDLPFPHTSAPQEFTVISDTADTSVIILDSPTPVRATKKRKIAISAPDQSQSEEDSNDAKKGASVHPNTPTVTHNPSASIKADMKRLLQSPEAEISKYYQIKSNTKLVLIQGNSGDAPYRYHPETIKELNDYFNDFRNLCQTEDFNFIQFIKEKYSGLIAKLAQDSQVPQSDLLVTLKSILFPLESGLKEFPLDSSLLDGIVEKVSYGHPEAGNNFTSWTCTFWQVKELDLLGEAIGKHFLNNFVIRNAARMILESALKAILPDTDTNINSTNPLTTTVDDLPMNLMKIESGTGTPKKKERKEKLQLSVPSTGSIASAAAAAAASMTPQIPQVKIK